MDVGVNRQPLRLAHTAHAVARCAGPFPEALKNGQAFDTVIGPITFDAKGDILNATYDINVWHDGKYGKLQQ